MKLVWSKPLVALVMGAAAAVAAMAACGSSNSNPNMLGGPSGPTNGDDATLPSTSSGGSGGSSGAGSDTDAGVFMYDGAPTMVTDAALQCATPTGIAIRFNPMYSGFDGIHQYQVPALAPNADPSKLTWSSEDPSYVSMAPYLSGVMITTRKAGMTNIVVKSSDGTCGLAPIFIEQFSADGGDWFTGNARYNNGNALTFDNSAFLDGGYDGPIPDGGFDAAAYAASYTTADASDLCNKLMAINFKNPFEKPPAACTNCHGSMSNGTLFGSPVFSDVMHTPEQTGGFSPTDLTNVFTSGTVPDGGYFDNAISPYCVWHMFHTWQDISTSEQQTGMRSYLRALPPLEQTGCFELFNQKSCSDGGLGTGTGM